VAGVFARCDQRVGVHKAPANERLEGVLELETALTDDQQGPLNEQNVNCIRAFPRRGIRVWGARTLSSGSAWRYINERRVILTAVRWIDLNLADTVFEANTPRLWDRIVRELTAYLTDLVRRGALSAPPDGPAFYVKCDAETNPKEIQEAGVVVTEIGLRPARPAEFIVIRIIHSPTGVRVEESGP
jgi:phage tail sheath protein FI